MFIKFFFKYIYLSLNDNMVLLWENTSPTSDFEEQTISLDFSKYNFVILTSLFTKTDRWVCATLVLPTNIQSQYFRSATTDNVNIPLSREGSISPTGIYFKYGYYQGHTDAMMIPFQIIGIREGSS